jgi:hypothetical protein
MTETIEQGIPVPATVKYRSLDKLQVGESALFAADGLNVGGLLACIQYRQRRYGKRWTLRKVENGYRVWRTA